MRYEDFVIQIGPDSGQGYSVSVVKSPAGEGSGFFRLPFDEVEMGQIFGALRRHAEAERSDDATRDLTPAPTAEEDRHFTPRQVGSALFRSLFSGQIRTLFDQSVGSTGAHDDTGLRIQIKLNPEHPDLARLYSLPWEFLYKSDTQDFLSLSRLSPVVRYVDVSRPTSPFPLPSPLRILVVIASPRGLAELNLKRERVNIESAWGRNKNVEVVFLLEASLGTLREELLEGPFHVLHFMGHGGFDSRSGEGVLYFVGSDGSRQPVSGQVLSSKLKDFKTLRLVFLNACNTAKAAGTAGINPFAGVASALVLGGMPAVVAMQLPISDHAAIAFSRAFYQRLAAGEPVDTAVAEGRQAVHSEDTATTEWATPVLFLRTPDGALFSRSTAPSQKGPESRLLGGMSAPAGALLRGAKAPKKSSAIKKAVGFIALFAIVVGTVVAALKFGLRGSAPVPARDSVSAISAPVGTRAGSPLGETAKKPTESGSQPAPDPITTVKKSDPMPVTILEINQSFNTSIEGFTGWLGTVEMRGDRMRWNFHFLNNSTEERNIGFNYRETYVADESGNRYGVIEAESAFNVSREYEWTVQKGVRLDRWFDFSLPKTATKKFTVGLISHSPSSPDYYPSVKPFTVTLP